MIPGTGTRYQVPGIYSKQQFAAFIHSLQVTIKTNLLAELKVPRSYCCTKRVTPLESSHGHLPTRAASARAVRGRCFDPKRAATAPGCRACSASPDRASCRLSINSRQDQTQAHSSSSSTRGLSTTPDDGSHIYRIVPPRCRTESSWLRSGRVWTCT